MREITVLVAAAEAMAIAMATAAMIQKSICGLFVFLGCVRVREVNRAFVCIQLNLVSTSKWDTYHIISYDIISHHIQHSVYSFSPFADCQYFIMQMVALWTLLA